jgi:DNA modification methylase
LSTFRDRIREFRRVRARDSLPHPKNPKVHPESQIAALRGIIDEVGFASALIGRELPDGRIQILDGHARAGLLPDEELPVLLLDLDEKEAEKLLVSLDPIAAMAQQHDEKLRDLIAGLQTESGALRSVWDDLVKPLPSPGLADPDAAPEPPAEPTVKRGEIWKLGAHRLMCGDAGSVEEVDRLLEGAPVHLAVQDPPYGVKVEPRSNNAIAAGLSSFTNAKGARRKGGLKHHQGLDLARHPEKAKPTHRRMRAKDRPLENDFLPEEEFAKLLLAWFGNLARVLRPGHAFYCWGGYSNLGNFPPALKASGLYFSQAIIWNKLHPVLTRIGCFELAYYGWKEGAAHRFFGPPSARDLWDIRKDPPQSYAHLTQKPVELSVRAIEYSSKRGENVLDLFGGSGSTLIACEQTGRRCFMLELDELYASTIVERWEKFTGRRAERA